MVDLLVLTPKSLFFVEIKSYPGEIGGDAGSWMWTTPKGRRKVFANPRLWRIAKPRNWSRC